MRVLHLPINIASQISTSVRALNSIGIDARGLVTSLSTIQSTKNVQLLPTVGTSRAKRAGQYVRKAAKILPAIQQADVLHWHFGATTLPKNLDLQWSRLLKKPGLVEFWGSDIRISEIDCADNPYYATARHLGQYPMHDDYQKSRETQARFANAGMACLISCHSLQPYIQPDLFNKVYFARQRIFLSDFVPIYPRPEIRRPLVVHSPSNPTAKGTAFVRAAVNELRDTFDFEYREITNMPHDKALKNVQQCDVFLDQFISGGHGLAALEAMAFGKPALCYIKPSMVNKYPSDLPIVNASQDTLVDSLRSLLVDGKQRNILGQRGRSYVETYHDAEKIAWELKDIYEELIKAS